MVRPAPTITRVHRTGDVTLWDYTCRAERGDTGATETTGADMVVLPYHGHFEWRTTHSAEPQVAGVNTALWCRGGQGYHVAHPVCGGDRCSVLAFGPALAARGGAVAARAVPVAARLHLQHRRLRRQLADAGDPLASDEALLAFAEAVAPLRADRVDDGVTARQRAHVRQAQELLHAHFDQRLGLQDIARLTGTSVHHLARSFRRVVGTTIHRYVLTLRTRAALEAVLAGHRDLTALALSLGFCDHAHLTRVFVRHFGLPPRAARSPR